MPYTITQVTLLTMPSSRDANFWNALGERPMLNCPHCVQKSTIGAVNVVPLSEMNNKSLVRCKLKHRREDARVMLREWVQIGLLDMEVMSIWKNGQCKKVTYWGLPLHLWRSKSCECWSLYHGEL